MLIGQSLVKSLIKAGQMYENVLQEAQEWSRCIDTLKASVDSMYEICRIQQNIMGCEEAIMFLKCSVRDFVSLIDTIKIEQNWENSEKRPMTSVAWEIRGSASRNALLPPPKTLKEKQCQTPNNYTENLENLAKAKENEWQLVCRRKNSTAAAHLIQTEQQQEEEERKLMGAPFARVTKAPKSAMDLPQTKASLAKMAYSRQLLSAKHTQMLMEKLNKKRRMEKQNERKDTTTAAAVKEKQQPSEVRREQIVLPAEEKEQLPECLKTLMDQLSDDCEWRAMTEEEESLAQEEESLKKEIEEEEENLSPFEDEPFPPEEEVATDTEKKEERQQHYRNPGELAQLRAKLLSPTKRRKTEDVDHSSDSKLQRAEKNRTALQQEKAQCLRLLHQRVEEVRKKREEIQQRKLAHLEMVKERIQKAEEKRQKSLEEIVQRAQEDEMKIMEINLLNSFGAANQKLEKRYTQMREKNRYDKQVQKAEEARQRRIGENRQQREEAEKRRKDAQEKRAQRFREQADQHQERQTHALKHRVKTMEQYKAKVAQHSQKIDRQRAKEQAEKQRLLDKIQQKHEKRTENYEQCKEQVRRRAMELSSPRPSHFWAQALADFSQMPADLALQQKEPDQLEVSCFRCNQRLLNDLHLVSHVLSEEHLSRAGKTADSVLQNGTISYDFLKNEFDKMVPATGGEESVTTSINSSSADESQLMSKSSEEIQMGVESIRRTIARNSQMLVSDQSVQKLLTAEMSAVGKLSASAKKKRNKLRQRFVCEFELLDKKLSEVSQQQKGRNKTVDQLLARIAKCTTNSGTGTEELAAVERGLIELLKALQNAPTNSQHERSLLFALNASNLLAKLFVLVAPQKEEPCTRNGQKTRILQKALSVLAIVVAHNIELGGSTLLHLCDLFGLCAQKTFSSCPGLEAAPLDGASFTSSLFILHQIGLSFARPDTGNARLVFGYLYACCSLLEFIACCGRLELAELVATVDLAELLHRQRISPCEMLSHFTTAALYAILEENRRKEPSPQPQQLVRTDSGSDVPDTALNQQVIDRLRNCQFVWLYLLTVHAYQFNLSRQQVCPVPATESNTNLPNSPPGSPSKSDPMAAKMAPILYKCYLAQFEAISAHREEISGTRRPLFLQKFMDIELGQTMCTRTAAILRSILQAIAKSLGHPDSKQEGISAVNAVGQCIQAIGSFASLCPANQLLCVLGWQRSILCTLCSLPLEFVHTAPLKHALLPCLIVILRNSTAGVGQIHGEFCLHYFIDYLKDALSSKRTHSDFAYLADLMPSRDQWTQAKQFLEEMAGVNPSS